MCRQITCKQCKRPTWAGCGAHIEQVLAHIPVDQRCACAGTEASMRAGGLFGLLGTIFKR